MHIPFPEQSLGQSFPAKAEQTPSEHRLEIQALSELHVSPICLRLLARPHGLFESPLTPINPDKQGPQVRAVKLQWMRFINEHSTGTEQLTEFMVLVTAPISCETAPGLLLDSALAMADDAMDANADMLFGAVTCTASEVFPMPPYTSDAKAKHVTSKSFMSNPFPSRVVV
jgi:hypothetical protein